MQRKQIRLLNIADESTVYSWLCTAIIYTLIFWTYLNSIFCILLAAYWLFCSKKRFDLSVKSGRMMLLFVSLYLVFLSGIFYTANMQEGLYRLQEKSPILLFPLIFGTTNLLTKAFVTRIRTHFIMATIIACFISFIVGIVGYVQTGSAAGLVNQHITLFKNVYPYIMGLFSLLSIVFLLYDLPVSPKKRIPLFAAVAFLSLFIMTNGVRVIITCWFLVVLFFTFKYIKTIQYRLLIAISMIAFICVAIATIPVLHRQWNELTDFSRTNTISLDQDSSLGKSWGGKSVRIALWKCSEDLVRKHWLTGVGTGDAQDSLQQAYENRKFYFASRYNRYNSHNQYIQILISNGIMGLLVLLLCIIIPFSAFRNNAFSQIYFLFLGLFFIICFTEVVLDTNKGIILYSFFNSIFAFSTSDREITS